MTKLELILGITLSVAAGLAALAGFPMLATAITAFVIIIALI